MSRTWVYWKEKNNSDLKEIIKMKKNKYNQDTFTNRFTGEELSTYPTPFAELSKVSKRTKNENKLNSQIEKFTGRYICKFCGEKMDWVSDTNVMVCKNPLCNGHEKTLKNKNGDELKLAEPSMKILTKRGTAIAETLLG